MQTFQLEDWDKPVFKVIYNNEESTKNDSDSELGTLDSLGSDDKQQLLTFTQLYKIIMKYQDTSKVITLKMHPIYREGEVMGSKFERIV